MLRELQIISVFGFLLVMFVLFVSLDYTHLVDPRHYILASIQSNDFQSAIEANKGWLTDFIFVFLISSLGLLSVDEASIFPFFVLLHFLIVLCIALKVKNQKLVLLFIICTICNLSFVTGILNVWRQSLFELIVLLSVVGAPLGKSNKILFLFSFGFHHLSAIYYYLVWFITSKGWKVLFLSFASVFGLYFLLAGSIAQLQWIIVYGNSHHDNNYNRIIAISMLFVVALVTKPKNKHSANLTAIIFVMLIANLVLYQIAPSATNRLLRIVFTIYPAIFLFASTGREVITSGVVLILYFLLNIVFILSSNTYGLLHW